eukprot:CAMPEP_0194125854 /NCGR_PEP_ID=MMETSP0150-20130528/59681_1 /TAXON_ID=122233 /ORGANISM="Chaetoceros debilis, Strain MM31A-1" /LENGTH=377 /DNA_ID=CAMNT_0038819681 /DNA_START=142 /DNA_END=1276 /DNA_ORIENTATION=+
MRLLIYRGLEVSRGHESRAFKDATHVIVDESVTVIKNHAFRVCYHLVSIIMGDSVKRIEGYAFNNCRALRFVRMSKALEYIGPGAFCDCWSLEALFLPSTVNSIGHSAFSSCPSLRFLILPHDIDIDLGKVGEMIIEGTGIQHIARTAGVAYEMNDDGYDITDESNHRVNEWLIHHMDESPSTNFATTLPLQQDTSMRLPHDIDLSNVGHVIITSTGIQQIARTAGVEYEMNNVLTGGSNRRVNEWLIHQMDESPFHKLCYDTSVTSKQINDYLIEHDNDSALQTDGNYGMTPLHMLAMNPHAPADSISTLLNSNQEAVFSLDNEEKTPLDYARDYNVGGLVGMITGLCNQRNSSAHDQRETIIEETVSTSKRRKIG